MKETYKNLIELIEINENIKFNCESNLRLIQKFILKQAPKSYSCGTSYVDADCIHGSRNELNALNYKKLIDEMEKLNSMIFLQEEILKGYYEAKQNIDVKLKTLKGINYNVAYLKLVEGYSLKAIAIELNISYDYAMKISAKI